MKFLYLNDDIFSEISKYLTITENFNLMLIKNDIFVDWKYLQKRDFPHVNIELSKNNAIDLDFGNIISYIVDNEYYNKKREDLLINNVVDEQTRIAKDNFTFTKTEAMKKFKLNKEQIEKISIYLTLPNPNYEGSHMYLYRIKDLFKLIATIKHGITNFNIGFIKKYKKNYECIKCNYKTDNKWKYDRHNNTKAHQLKMKKKNI